MAPNVLFVTLDQFRGDSLSCLGHPVVRTPHLDALAAAGTHFVRHHTQSTPCAPGRAGLYTGMYQMNHRVVANGTPLDDRFDNVARLANRAGLNSVLFGYTDQSIDPRVTSGPEDPRLLTYEGLLPGFDWRLDLTGDMKPWVEHLASLGHDTTAGNIALLASEHARPAEHGISAFTTDRIVEWLETRDDERPFFLHASYLRPHPPYSAPGHFADLYDPADVGLPLAPVDERHPAHDLFLSIGWVTAPTDEAAIRRLRAHYYGMITAVDHEVGRLVDALARLGLTDTTTIVVTADHGEQLGDHGLVQKVGWFEESHHVPLIWFDPRTPGGGRVEAFTESIDVMPTLAETWNQSVPLQCDGLPLTPFLEGRQPPWWRTVTAWEFDWRFALIPLGDHPWPWNRDLEKQNLAVVRDETAAYVQFGDGSWLAFDLAADPTWRTPLVDTERVLELTREMLLWRSRHGDRTHTGLLVTNGGVGRWPDGVPWR
ncbi:MAG: sulfatase-like hydrolase/transferase [Ilumatobacteraceae bacterium]